MRNTQSILQITESVLFFLAVLLLPTQLGKHFWPQSAFIYSLKIDYLSPTIYFWDLLVLLLLTVAGFNLLRQKKKISLNKPFAILLGIFFLSLLPSLLGSLNPEAGLVQIKDYLSASLFGLYIAGKDSVRIRKLLFPALIISFIFICALGLLQFLLGRSLGFWVLGERDFSVTTPLVAKFNYYDKIFLRPYSTFSHPNLFGGFLMVTMPLVLYGLPKVFRKIALILGLLGCATVLVTFSRPALILLAVYFLVIYRKYWKLMLVTLVLLSPLVVVRFVSIFTFDTLAILRRQELQEYSVELFKRHIWSGTGVNNFVNALAIDKILVGTSRFLQPVHNIFLLILSETGLIGLAGFLLMFLTSVYKNIKNDNYLSRILLASLLSITFLGLFDHYFITLPQGQRVLFLILGLSFRKSSVNIG